MPKTDSIRIELTRQSWLLIVGALNQLAAKDTLKADDATKLQDYIASIGDVQGLRFFYLHGSVDHISGKYVKIEMEAY